MEGADSGCSVWRASASAPRSCAKAECGGDIAVQLPSNSLQGSGMDRQSALIGAVLSDISRPLMALRDSCPAALTAEAGLRWCGVSPPYPTEDLNTELLKKLSPANSSISAASRMRRTADDPKTKKTETGLKHARVFARGQQCQ